MNKPLSPAAQAVMHAYLACGSNESAMAAALRAVVEQVVPAPPECGKPASDWVRGMEDRQRIVRLLSSADELEPPNA
jgi:hypothetical protein